MMTFWTKRIKEGRLTENPQYTEEIDRLRASIRDQIRQKFAGSLAVRMVDSGSCNACEAECNALSNPYYDLERLGIYFVASPRHADVMLLSGVMTFNMFHHVLDAYAQMAHPKWIITLGNCPTMSGPFTPTFAIKAPVADHLPIAYHIPGCPPEPDAILRGFLDFLTTFSTENTHA